jgi:hypothetical protein
MNIQVGDLLKRRVTDSLTNYQNKRYALVLEVDIYNDTVVCEYYPSGLIQGNSCSSVRMWYEKV